MPSGLSLGELRPVGCSSPCRTGNLERFQSEHRLRGHIARVHESNHAECRHRHQNEARNDVASHRLVDFLGAEVDNTDRIRLYLQLAEVGQTSASNQGLQLASV
jgi:hypothetical protein